MRHVPLVAVAVALVVGCGGSPAPRSVPASGGDSIDASAPLVIAPVPSAAVTAAPSPTDVPYDPPPPDPTPVAPVASSSAADDDASQPWNRKPSASEKKACAARGGKLQPVCMSGALECVIHFRDAGKRCSDKKDCTGECLIDGNTPPVPGHAVGACQENSDPCGCKTPIDHGNVGPGICTD